MFSPYEIVPLASLALLEEATRTSAVPALAALVLAAFSQLPPQLPRKTAADQVHDIVMVESGNADAASHARANCGYHAHDGYILAGSIVRRLYLMTRRLAELGHSGWSWRGLLPPTH